MGGSSGEGDSSSGGDASFLAAAIALLDDGDALGALDALRAIVFAEGSGTKEFSEVREQGIYKLGQLLAQLGRTDDIVKLSRDIRPFFDLVSKAKTAKIVRTLVDVVCEVPDVVKLQVALSLEVIAWSRETKRTFLRHRIETRLANLYLISKSYKEALDTILKLNREVKKLDDKLLLVDIQLVESRIQHMLHNLPKSKAALTAARTNANAIYCPPSLQTQLDMQSGVLHAEEKDYKTAYSYFFEAFEGLSTMDENATAKLAAIEAKAESKIKLTASQSVLKAKAEAAQAVSLASSTAGMKRSQSQVFAQQQSASESPRDAAARALKYMLLAKIMTDSSTDVDAIIASKGALRYAGDGIEAMRSLAHAHRDRSLKQFEQAKADFQFEVEGDEIVRRHLEDLYERLLEQNISRVVEPFSVVENTRVAELVGLPLSRVEAKLSQMILDSKLDGILDQAEGHLRLFEAEDEDKVYVDALGTVENLGHVVDSLYDKANKHL